MSSQPSWLRRLTTPFTRRDSTLRIENVSTPDSSEVWRTLRRDQRNRAVGMVTDRNGANGRVVFKDEPPLFVTDDGGKVDTASSDVRTQRELLNELVDAQNVMLAAEAAEFAAEVSFRDAQAETAAADFELRKARRRVAGGDR